MATVPFREPPRPHKPPSPPAHLSPAAKAWWQAIVGEYRVESFEIALLEQAAMQLDIVEAARAEIARDGSTYVTHLGVRKQNPAIGVLNAAVASYARICRQLKLRPETQKPLKRDMMRWQNT